MNFIALKKKEKVNNVSGVYKLQEGGKGLDRFTLLLWLQIR